MMMQRFRMSLAAAAALGAMLMLSAATSHAAIMYVDAVEGPSGNTFATGGTLADTSWLDVSTTNPDNDDWRKRDDAAFGFTNGGSVFQAITNLTTATIPELTTQITGLADGTYEVYAFFWDQVMASAQLWNLSAGLAPGTPQNPLTTYKNPADTLSYATSVGVVDAGSLQFANSVATTTDPLTQRMFAISLGQVVVSGGSPINVHIDHFPTINGGLRRSIYDGVGYERVVPEPSSLAILGLGGLLFAWRRLG